MSCPALSCRAGHNSDYRPVLPLTRTDDDRTAGQDRTEKVVLCPTLAQMKDRTK